MAVEVTRDATDWREPAENCCICRQPTRYWYGTGDRNVALCQACAQGAEADKLPTKREWCAAERIRNKRRSDAPAGSALARCEICKQELPSMAALIAHVHKYHPEP